MRATSSTSKKIALPAGFAELMLPHRQRIAYRGIQINVYLMKNDKRSTLLGSTNVNVKEFLPDRMKIEGRLSKTSLMAGSSRDKCAQRSRSPISTARRPQIGVLPPSSIFPLRSFCFPELGGFIFFDSLRDDKKQRRAQLVELGEKKPTTMDGLNSICS